MRDDKIFKYALNDVHFNFNCVTQSNRPPIHLLRIGSQVNRHRRRDESCLLRFVDQKLPELASWVDKSQLEEGNVPLPQARHTLNQLMCIQSAMQIFVGKAKPTTNLETVISKVKCCVEQRLESEIQEKVRIKSDPLKLKSHVFLKWC